MIEIGMDKSINRPPPAATCKPRINELSFTTTRHSCHSSAKRFTVMNGNDRQRVPQEAEEIQMRLTRCASSTHQREGLGRVPSQ